MALKMFVFTQAEQDYIDRPPVIYLSGKEVNEDDFVSAMEKCEEKCDLSEEQKEQIDSWLNDYGLWKQEQISTDYTTQKRHRDMSQSLAFILIGLPLYLYHWSVIKRETK